MAEDTGMAGDGAGDVGSGEDQSCERELSALNLLVSVTSAGLELTAVLSTALDAAAELLGLPMGMIVLWDDTRRSLRVAARRQTEGTPIEAGTLLSEGDFSQLLSGRAFAEQAPLFVADLRCEPAYADLQIVRYGIVAAVAIPLTVRERPLGVLTLASPAPRSFSSADRHILLTIGRQVAIAIENARAYAEAEQRAATLKGLLNTTQELNSTLDLRHVLEVIAHQVRALIEVDSLFISLLNPESKVLTPVIALHDYADQVLGLTIKLGEGLTGRVALTGVGEIVNSAQGDPRTRAVPDTPDVPEALLAAPMLCKGRVIGVMTLSRLGHREFSQADLDLLNSFAGQAAIAVENARLYTESRQYARGLERAQARLLKAQDQLLQAEKLSAIGQLAAGMAHELNNPLTAIVGFAQLLEQEPLSPTGRADVRRIQMAAARAQKILANLLTFAHQQRTVPEPTDLAALIERLLERHGSEFAAAGVCVRQELEQDVGELCVDPAQMEQLVWHLARNACQAMSQLGGGTLTVRLSRPAPDRVRLEVLDEGPGIPADILPHIFSPFFTTNDVGKGQGLGLATCFGIVHAHQGRIWAEPRPEGGARFVVELPPMAQAACRPHELPTERSVLVVTADETLGSRLVALVEDLGHRPAWVPSGEAALAEAVVRRYDLVLCDVNLPGLGIARLYESLNANYPGSSIRFAAIGAAIPGLPGLPVIAAPLDSPQARELLATWLAESH